MRRAMPTAAVAAEEFPVGQARSLGYHLHPPVDLRIRQPEDLLTAGHARRPDRVQGPHGGVMATTAPWASVSVLERMTVMRPLPSPQRCTSPQVSAAASLRRRGSSRAGEVAALPQLGMCNSMVHDAGIPGAVAVAVAVGDPLWAAFADLGGNLRRP